MSLRAPGPDNLPAPVMTMSTIGRLKTAGIALAVATTSLSAAPPQSQFTTRSELVVLHVRVTDRGGSYATGLTERAFRILEDGLPQDVRFFENADAPATIGLVIDSSGSMRNVRERVITAAAEFVSSSNPDDEVFALVFNDSVRAVLDESEPFTGKADTLRKALANVFEPVGRTALYDAMAGALAYGSRGARDRRAIVVLSDGGDNASKTKFQEALELVESSNAIVYTVALADPYDLESDPKRLARFAETSGGRAFSPKDAAGIHKAFQQIARDIRHSYTIGYEPRQTARQAGFRRIRVEAYGPGGRKLDARTRTGYLAPAEAVKGRE
jgi:Ca-activated chloride channel homolog